MISTTLPDNLKENDIEFLQRHEEIYLLHHEITSRFLSLIREYPDCKRDDFSKPFGATLNYLFDRDTGELKHLREGNSIVIPDKINPYSNTRRQK